MKASGSQLLVFLDKEEGNLKYLVEYDQETTSYIVSVYNKNTKQLAHEQFTASSQPILGLSSSDSSKITNLIRKLSQQL